MKKFLLLIVFSFCFASDYWTLPIAGADTLAAGVYEPRSYSNIIMWHPVFKKLMRVHGGLDIPCNQGTPVYATVPGKIIEVGNDPLKLTFDAKGNVVSIREGFGNFIRWKDDYGNIHRVAHLYKPVVKEGDDVSAGQLIGEAGWTGLKNVRNHVHYDVRDRDGHVMYITKKFGIVWKLKK